MSSETAVADEGNKPTRVELFVRSLAPDTARDQQEAVIERLQSLLDRSRIAAFDVYLCGDCVCPSTVAAQTDTGQFLLERYEAFEAWADERDRDLVGFRERCVESTLADDTVTGIAFPRICLAEFADETLQFVAPSAGSETTTVSDRLDSLDRPGSTR